MYAFNVNSNNLPSLFALVSKRTFLFGHVDDEPVSCFRYLFFEGSLVSGSGLSSLPCHFLSSQPRINTRNITLILGAILSSNNGISAPEHNPTGRRRNKVKLAGK